MTSRFVVLLVCGHRICCSFLSLKLPGLEKMTMLLPMPLQEDLNKPLLGYNLHTTSPI